MNARGTLQEFRHLRVAVIGDLCLDVYLEVKHGGSERSRETGRRAAGVVNQRYSLGAAANVAANAAALGATVEAFGVVGNDPYGRELRRQLTAAGIDGAAVIIDTAWSTCAYIKHTTDGRETGRFDTWVANALAETTAGQLVASLEQRLPHLDVVIINQQLHPGIHTPATHRALSELIERGHDAVTWVSDTRDVDATYLSTIRKLGEEQLPRRSLRRQRRQYLQRLVNGSGPLFVTLGARGAITVTPEETERVPAHRIDGPVDPVGAGDAFTVGVALALTAGLAPLQAARFANAVAAATVQKIGGTGTAAPEEVATLLADV